MTTSTHGVAATEALERLGFARTEADDLPPSGTPADVAVTTSTWRSADDEVRATVESTRSGAVATLLSLHGDGTLVRTRGQLGDARLPMEPVLPESEGLATEDVDVADVASLVTAHRARVAGRTATHGAAVALDDGLGARAALRVCQLLDDDLRTIFGAWSPAARVALCLLGAFMAYPWPFLFDEGEAPSPSRGVWVAVALAVVAAGARGRAARDLALLAALGAPVLAVFVPVPPAWTAAVHVWTPVGGVIGLWLSMIRPPATAPSVESLRVGRGPAQGVVYVRLFVYLAAAVAFALGVWASRSGPHGTGTALAELTYMGAVVALLLPPAGKAVSTDFVVLVAFGLGDQVIRWAHLPLATPGLAPLVLAWMVWTGGVTAAATYRWGGTP